jgi:hypothetical protein
MIQRPTVPHSGKKEETMATVTRTTKIVHYASFMLDGNEVYGTAERTTGGYIFRPETGHKAVLVDYRNVELYLFGVVDLAHTQWAIDEANGGLVRTCSQTLDPDAGSDDAPDMQRW